MMVIGELGREHVKIKGLGAKSSLFSFFGKVIDKTEPKEFDRADGEKGWVATLLLGTRPARPASCSGTRKPALHSILWWGRCSRSSAATRERATTRSMPSPSGKQAARSGVRTGNRVPLDRTG